MQTLIRTPSVAACKGILQLEATFIYVKQYVSPPGLEPGSLE